MERFKLQTKEVTLLRVQHRLAKRDGRVNHAYRLNALILLGECWSYKEVSETLLLDEDTLRRYVNKYKAGGVDFLLTDDCIGYTGRLSDSEIAELEAHLGRNHI